jgi:hypothetical protein
MSAVNRLPKYLIFTTFFRSVRSLRENPSDPPRMIP